MKNSNSKNEEEYKKICNCYRESIFHLLHRQKDIEQFIENCKDPNKKVVYMSQRMKEIISTLLYTFAAMIHERPEGYKITDSILRVPKKSYVKIAEREPLCEDLNFFLEHLRYVDENVLRLRNSSEVFDYITDGYSIVKPFIYFLSGMAEINQAKVKRGAKKIEAFGALDDLAFQEKMQELSTDLHIEGPDEDKAMIVRQVFVYYGCSEILPGELHDSTIFSGSSAEDFKQFLDVTEDQRLGGTLEGIVVHNNPTDTEVPNEKTSSGELHYYTYRKDHYLITAGHCLVDFEEKLYTPQVVAEYNADGDSSAVIQFS